jgi:glycogen(starch) synthase
MRILLVSHRFYPDVGGIEAMSKLLAAGFAKRGHVVTVVTHSRGKTVAMGDYTVVRAPGPAALWRVSRKADVVFHNNICLRFAWPLLVVRRPWVVAVRTWVRRNDGTLGIRDRLKRNLLHRATIISNSRASADDLEANSVVIPNAYDDAIYMTPPNCSRAPNSLVFVGRLVESKGLHLLLEALVDLRSRGLRPSLTVIGDGPAREDLEVQARRSGLTAIRFLGSQEPPAVARVLFETEVIVIPSLWREPFGIVALEGIACGCVPIASSGGGLGEAVGSAGLLFSNGDVHALSSQIARLLTSPRLLEDLRREGRSHIQRYSSDSMVEAYLKVLTESSSAALPSA